MTDIRPSAFIRRHLAGGAHDLDDLVSWLDRQSEYQDVLERIHLLNAQLTGPGEAPLGVYKPEARVALDWLAQELEREGR